MSNGVNMWVGIGNITKDIEVRYIASGNAVCTLRLACNERRKDGENGWKDHAEFIDVVCWGKTAENVGQYLAKGSQVYVEGRLQTREYDDKEGVKRWKTEVVANQVLFLDKPGAGAGAKQGGSGSTNTERAGQGKGQAPSTPQGGADAADDPLPF